MRFFRPVCMVLCVLTFSQTLFAVTYQQGAGDLGLVTIQAEQFSGNVSQSGHTWQEVVIPGAVGSAMQPQPPGLIPSWFNANYAANAPRLDYSVQFNRTGTHYIWVRAWAANGWQDSCHAGLDGQEIASADRIAVFLPYREWVWSNETMDAPRATFEVPSVGLHTVNLWMREARLNVDQIVLTTDPDYRPGERSPAALPDFDSDGQADVATYYPPTGAWSYRESAAGQEVGRAWGWSGAEPALGDYDGDGLSDIAVYQPTLAGLWSIEESGTGALREQNWGWSLAQAVQADYDGDGRTDVAVYQPSLAGLWNIQLSSGGSLALNWGWSEAMPVPADYDGDGQDDIAVYHPESGTWYIRESATGQLRLQQWGWSEAVPVPADYDGDLRADIAVYQPTLGGLWTIQESRSGATVNQGWGWSGADAVPADYDGDGRADMAVMDPATGDWYVRQSGQQGRLALVNWCRGASEPALPIYQRQKAWGFTHAPRNCDPLRPERLIIFGDSVSVGADADPGKEWAALLRDDLRARFGQDLDYITVAEGGNFTADLATQRARLQSQLALPARGHTVVAMTIGGVDLVAKYDAGESLVEPALSAALVNLAEHLDALFDPAVFPDGVTVYLMFIFDPTDGLSADPWCFTQIDPLPPLSASMQAWAEGYRELAAAFSAQGKPVTYVDIITPFFGHGHNHELQGGTNWFLSPPCAAPAPCEPAEFGHCLHPLNAGHEGIFRAILVRTDADFPSP